ncbi:MAG: hypothetical protein B7Y53_07860, partial [Halothiobacillus sp. 28-55-5]
MNGFASITRPLKWFSGLLLVAFVAGCGGGGGQAPILGSGAGTLTPSTLVDVIKPRVAVTLPANLEVVNAPINAAITATFNEPMLGTTITAASFTVVDTTASTTVTATGVTYDAASKTATFTHAPLTLAHSYSATIHGVGASVATDLAGNALAGGLVGAPNPKVAADYTWTFTATAADSTPPTITLENPADGVNGVALNASVNATFSKAMDPATICGSANLTAACPVATFTVQTFGPPLGAVLAGAVSYDSLTKIATFTPSVNLASNTKYQVTVTGAKDLAGNALAAGAKPNPWTFTTGTGLAPGAINLGTANGFGIMATAAVTAASASIINGDVSLEPGTSMTGFPSAIVNGSIHINDTVSHQARADLLAAYNTAKGLACATNVGSADLGGLYVYPAGIPPGVYCSGSSMLVGTHIVLDAGGNANAVWVFQIGSSLTTGA